MLKNKSRRRSCSRAGYSEDGASGFACAHHSAGDKTGNPGADPVKGPAVLRSPAFNFGRNFISETGVKGYEVKNFFSASDVKISSKGQIWIPGFIFIACFIAFPVCLLQSMDMITSDFYGKGVSAMVIYAGYLEIADSQNGHVGGDRKRAFEFGQRFLVSVFPKKSRLLSQPAGEAFGYVLA